IILLALSAAACSVIPPSEQTAVLSTATPPEITAFTASPSKIENGSVVTLQWQVKNADSIVIDNGIGPVEPEGSLRIKPYELTAYNLTATNEAGNVGSAVIVNVIPFVRIASPVNSQTGTSAGIPSNSLPRLINNESYVFFNGAVMVGADEHYIVLRNNPNAHKPSWTELKAFLESDSTDRHAYIAGTYTCGDFAETLHNNAEVAGIRAAIVAIELKSPVMAGAILNHSLNAFETTDRGIMYIDDTSSSSGYYADKVASLKIGDDYTCVSIFPQRGQLQTWPSMGKVLAIDIFQW
ncbi:MAG: hypothetical protein NTZ34_11415, partial [Chloroflexi bacterium]|nr:hypothetical protein [Chloroflexota bacterium]